MLLRWQSKPRFDASRPASGRLPAKSGRPPNGRKAATQPFCVWLLFAVGCCFLSKLGDINKHANFTEMPAGRFSV